VPKHTDTGPANVLLQIVGDLRLFAREGGETDEILEDVDGVSRTRGKGCHCIEGFRRHLTLLLSPVLS
jgi:hypothetical protein